MFQYLAIACVVLYAVDALPAEPLFQFSNGRIGVNFLGYQASAGLGGLLTGSSSDGGLFASAQTPNGQKVVAGGGGISGNRGSGGGLFAGAQSGYGQNAAAGLGGTATGSGSFGGKFAHADNGYGHRTGTASFGGNPASLQDFLNILAGGNR